jgi:hypothetical protein
VILVVGGFQGKNSAIRSGNKQPEALHPASHLNRAVRRLPMPDLLDYLTLFDYRAIFPRLRDLSAVSLMPFCKADIAIALLFTKEFRHSVLLVDMREL